MNQIILSGQLGHDPRYAANMVQFALGTTEKVTVNSARETEKDTYVEWHRVIAKGTMVDKVRRAELKGGMHLAIIGRLASRSFIAKDGTRKFVTEVEMQGLEIEKPFTPAPIPPKPVKNNC